MKKRIDELLRRGEDATLDYKQTVTSASKIAKTMSAFANHVGGILLIGVQDDRKICGVLADEEIYMLDMAARFYCKPEVDIKLIHHKVDGKDVVECLVQTGTNKPYYAKDENNKWWAYVRVADKTLLASKIVIDVLKRGSSGQGTLINYSSKETAILQYLSENERITLSQYKHMINISTRRATKIIVDLISAGVIRSHTTEKTEYYTLV